MNNKTILIYYIYVIFLLVGCSYVVFILGRSNWWFLLALILSDISPKNLKNE